MDVKSFLQFVYGDAPGYIEIRYIMNRKVKRQEFYQGAKDLLQHLPRVMQLSGKENIYIGIATRKVKSGSEKDVLGFPAIGIDIDKSITKLEQFPLSPSCLVASGHGHQAWWRLREFALVADYGLTEIRSLVKRLAAAIDGDPAATDPARVLRLPDTINVKDPNNPKPCRIIKMDTDLIYNLSEFEEYLPEENEETKQQLATMRNLPPENVLDCDFIQYCKEHARDLPEPLWYAMISNLARVKDGDKIIHQYSEPYPQYDPGETQKKIEHALQDTGPHTCKYIRENGFNCQRQCKVAAPVALATPLGANLILLENVKKDAAQNHIRVYQREVIQALAALPSYEYVEYKQQLKAVNAKINLVDLDKAVKSYKNRLPEEEKASFQDLLKETLQKDFEPIAWSGVSENIMLRVYNRKHKTSYDIKLSNPNSIPPVFALTSGTIFDWLKEHDISVPGYIAFRGDVPRDPVKQQKMLAEELLLGFQTIAQGIPKLKTEKILRQGLHIVDNVAIWINGLNVYVQEEGEPWQKIEGIKVKDAIIDADPHPWSQVESPCDIPPYTPKELFDILVEILVTGWGFKDAIDPYILALSMMKSGCNNVFERQEYIAIAGPSGSGKSRLIKGLLTGAAYMPRLVEASALETDITVAGLTSKYLGRACTMGYEEFDNWRRTSILDFLRSSMDSQVGQTRGTVSGGVRENSFRNPGWFHTLKPFARDEDVNRFYPVELPRDPNRGFPETLIQPLLAKYQPRDIAISITLGFLNNIWQLREIYQRLKGTKLAGEELGGSRFKEMLLGLFAILDLIGEDVNSFSQGVFESKANYNAMERENDLSIQLVNTILNTTLDWEGEKTTAQIMIARNYNRGLDVNLLPYGIYYQWKTRSIYINWPTVLRLLTQTEFNQYNVRQLREFARRHPGFMAHKLYRLGDYVGSLTQISLKEEFGNDVR